MDVKNFDSTAINPFAVYSKVQEALEGKIPNPSVVEFFITNFCSFKCPHCRCAQFHENSASYMGLDFIRRILDEIKAMGCNIIEFGGGGEPLEHPRILEIFDMLKERNMRCGIITNGYSLINNHKLANAILEVTDWIRISLDAVTNKTYRLVHGRKDLSYDALKLALKNLSNQASKNQSPVLRTRLGIKIM
jgi:MoaA/NifB/PqqE/SkfB family radical SAM enzyme